MFGSKPGDERYQGALNQFVITKLSGHKKTYWVFHTKGEDPVSVLITEFNRIRTPSDNLMDLVNDIVNRRTLTSSEWNNLPLTEIFKWASNTEKTNLQDVVSGGDFVSKVLGYEVKDAQ